MNSAIVNLLYPPRCPLCGEIVAKDIAHRKCISSAPFIGERVCMKCGKPIDDDNEEYCRDCKTGNHSFECGKAVFLYNKMMEESISSYKFLFKKEYGKFYAYAMYKRYGNWIRGLHIDAIIPVPISARKMRTRGYNQSYVVAKELGKLMGIKVIKNCLVRSRNTAPQKELTPEYRLLNLMKAFLIGRDATVPKRILIIDDIYTTGSTIEACTRVLKKNGANAVFFLTICIGKGQG